MPYSQINDMAYFNYHAIAKRLIAKGHLVKTEYIAVWNDVSPALVLFFDNHDPMPIRKEKWAEYEELIAGK